MPPLSLWQIIAATALASLLAGFGGGWAVNGWRLSGNLQQLKAEHATALAKQSELARNTETQNGLFVAGLSERIRQAEVKNGQLENERDAAIAAGTQRVYVRAKCPASMPANSATAAAGDGTGPELDPAYRQTLSDLRRGARDAAEQIAALQEWARATVAACGRQ